MKKLLNTLYVTTEESYASLDGENIVISSRGSELGRYPLSSLDSVYFFTYPGCSPALMKKCCESGIPLQFLTVQGRYAGRVKGSSRGNVLLRVAQVKQFTEKDLSSEIGNRNLVLIQNTVACKLANSIHLLKRTLKDYPEVNEDNSLSDCVEFLKSAIDQVYGQSDKTVIMGIEGLGARAYFGVFDRMLVKQRCDFIVSGRSKRPPTDRLNAVLSFLYTVYISDITAALESVGLDAYVGYYHELRPGRASLACDMVEEVRCIVERVVVSAINLKKLQADDFDEQPGGAVLLNECGRKKVLTLWQEKKRASFQHPYLKQKIQYGLLPFVQANLMAKYIRGEIDEYPNFILR